MVRATIMSGLIGLNSKKKKKKKKEREKGQPNMRKYIFVT
jgi:hypothetical protein